MVYVKRSVASPAQAGMRGRIGYQKSNVTPPNITTGYTGTGFVDGFTASGSGVSFTITGTTSDNFTSASGLRVGGDTWTARRGPLYPSPTSLRLGRMGHRRQSFAPHAGVHQVVLWFDASNARLRRFDNMTLIDEAAHPKQHA